MHIFIYFYFGHNPPKWTCFFFDPGQKKKKQPRIWIIFLRPHRGPGQKKKKKTPVIVNFGPKAIFFVFY